MKNKLNVVICLGDELLKEIRLVTEERKKLERTRQDLLRKGKELLALNRHYRNQGVHKFKNVNVMFYFILVKGMHKLRLEKGLKWLLSSLARDKWKRRYFDTKKATASLEETLKSLRQELEAFYNKLFHQLQARDGRNKQRRVRKLSSTKVSSSTLLSGKQ